MHRLRLVALCTVSAVAFVVTGCNESPPPPPPAAAATPSPAAPPPPPPSLSAELQRLAAEVYVFALPMVLTDLTREADAAGGGINTFRHRRTLPDATTGTTSPNADFLYSQAWLDLSGGPVILSVPDTRGRYYLVAILDAWSNVANSIGKRTSGTEARRFALVGPRYKGPIPEGTTEIRSPTELAWLFGRVAVNDRGELAAATRVQDQFRLAAPGARAKSDTSATAAARGAASDPRERLMKMDAVEFFTRFAQLLPGNPPAKDDAAMREKIAKLGIEPGKPYDPAKLDPRAADSVAAGVQTGREAIVSAARGGVTGDIRHGWRVDLAQGRWGTEYGRRAVAAWYGLGANAPEDAVFMATRVDAAGRRLDGANRYVLHFDSGKLPPTDGFWSLSLYDEKNRFVANPAGRFNVGSDDRPKPNSDGSLDLYIQSASPGKEREANWLPAPAQGPFNLMLRVYWPKPEILEGLWSAPGVRHESG